MKAVLFKNPNTPASSFHLQEDMDNHFYDIPHYHPEYQLTVIYEGEGTLFVGDRIDRFQAGDIFLLAPNLPHVFRNDQEYYSPKNNLKVHGISIYFRENSFGDSFFNLPEVEAIKALMDTSKGGLRFSGAATNKVHEIMLEMKNKKDLERLVSFMTLLETLSKTLESESISGTSYTNPLRELDNQRINVAFEYVMNNFKKPIRLKDVSEIANMSPSSFSRFFKQRTRKTFSRFVNEVRIGNACQLLKKNRCTIYESAYLVGYNNLSNFNRQFKSITGFSPREYIGKLNV